MRVVAVTQQYPPMSLVGSWIATHEFLAELARRGHHVDVYRRLSSAYPYEHEGVHVHAGRNDGPIIAAVEEADLVISHMGDDGFAAGLARRFGLPDVRMVHSHRGDALEVLDGCALAVFNSESLAALTGWPGRQLVAHPPVRKINARPGDRVTLVNLAESKGGELFWRLAKKLPDEQFLGVRGGWGLQIVFRRDNVLTLRTTPDMREVFARTRVLLMPSSYESWGMVGIEAMSCGIPVIAHPTPGLRESLGDAGIFCDRADEAAWLAALERLRDPAEWEAASRRAAGRAATLAAEDTRGQFAHAVAELAPVAA